MKDGDLIMAKLDAPKVADAAEKILRVFIADGLAHSQCLMALATAYHFKQDRVKQLDQEAAREYEKLFCQMTGIIRA